MKTVWSWICRLFTKENVGIIWRTLFSTAKEAIKNSIHDPAIQERAFTIVKSLMLTDKSAEEKKEAFNRMLGEYLKKIGVEVGTSTMNVIRELAVEAVKEAQKQEAAGGSTVAPCLFALVGLVLFGALNASAGTQCFVRRAADGEIRGVVGRVNFIKAISPKYAANTNGTVTLKKVTDIYQTQTVISTNLVEQTLTVPVSKTAYLVSREAVLVKSVTNSTAIAPFVVNQFPRTNLED